MVRMFFKAKLIGFCNRLGIGVRERGEVQMTPRVSFVCLPGQLEGWS